VLDLLLVRAAARQSWLLLLRDYGVKDFHMAPESAYFACLACTIA